MLNGIKVATWNIMFGLEYVKAAHYLSEHDVFSGLDVLFLQEMDLEGTKYIAKQLNWNYCFTSRQNHPKTNRPFGVSILSKHNISNAMSIPLPHSPLFADPLRSAIKATIKLNQITLDVCSVHSSIPAMSKSKRNNQIKHLLDFTKTWNSDMTIIAGDFNTVSKKSVDFLHQYWKSSNNECCSSGRQPTLKRFKSKFQLDHILVKNGRVDEEIITETNLSDHHILYASILPEKN